MSRSRNRIRSASLATLLAIAGLAPGAPAWAAGMMWSTFLGGTGAENPYGVAVDASGDIYVVGTTGSADFPVTPGAAQGAAATPTDVVVTKLRGDGTGVIWSTYLGGSGSEDGKAITVDAAGNVYVTGNTGSTNFPTTTGAWDRVHGGGLSDAFVTKLSPNGQTLLYSTYLGGNWDDYPRTIAVDASGNVFVAGSTNSLDFPVTAGVVKPVRNPSLVDGADGFITKLNPSGSALVWSTFFGSDGGTDNIFDLALDSSSRPTVVGWTLSPTFPTTAGAYDRTYDNRREGYVTRLNANGNGYVYSTLVGAMGHDECLSVALDASGAAYVTGKTEGNGFPTTGGAPQTSYGGGAYDAFGIKLSPNGDALLYSTYLGGTGSDIGYCVAVTGQGAATFAGSTDSGNYPVTSGAYDMSSNGGGDSFMSSLTGSGALGYSSYLGSTGAEYGQNVALKGNGHAILTGQTASSGFPTTSGAYDRTFAGGGNDDFVSSLDPGTGGSVGVEPGSVAGVTLAPAVPNPARDRTTLGFALTSAGHARLVIRDLQGRAVKVLADEDLPAGTFARTWDGRADDGAEVPAGMYFAELRTSESVAIQRIARVR